MPQWRWFVAQIAKRIWFRAALIGILSVLLALAANLLAPLIPYEFAKLGDGAVGTVLTVLASSMLAVTTFSLTAMVTAFSGASQSGTPRATELLVEDAVAQNALSTFLGAFLFSIVGIIALQANYYGPQARAILLLGSVFVIFAIAVTLLRWIAQLTHFGRVSDTIDRLEKKARDALGRYDGPMVLSGHADRSAPDDAPITVWSPLAGYVAHIDRGKLADLAEQCGSPVHLSAPAGVFVDRARPLAWVAEGIDDREECETLEEKISRSFTIARQRDFDQDPRFGVTVLGEVASRALSPAVNDPGTAIAVLSAGMRVFDDFLDTYADSAEGSDRSFEGLVEPALSLEEMVEDLVLPIARDGAGLAEVGIRLQHVLGSLAKRAGTARDAYERLADEALDRATAALSHEPDRRRVREAHESAFG